MKYFSKASQNPRHIWKLEVNGVKAELDITNLSIDDPRYLKRKVYPEVAAIVKGLGYNWESTRAEDTYIHLMEKILWKASLILLANEKATGHFVKPYHHLLPLYYYEKLGQKKFLEILGFNNFDHGLIDTFNVTINKMFNDI